MHTNDTAPDAAPSTSPDATTSTGQLLDIEPGPPTRAWHAATPPVCPECGSALAAIAEMTNNEGILTIKGHGFGPELHLTFSWDRFGRGCDASAETLAEAVRELHTRFLASRAELDAGTYVSTAPDVDDTKNWLYPHDYVADVEASRDRLCAYVNADILYRRVTTESTSSPAKVGYAWKARERTWIAVVESGDLDSAPGGEGGTDGQ